MTAEKTSRCHKGKEKVPAKYSGHYLCIMSILALAVSYIVGGLWIGVDPRGILTAFEKQEDVILNQGGWLTNEKDIIIPPGPCNIPIIHEDSLSTKQFLERFAYKTPVVIRFNKDSNEEFRNLCERERLLRDWGHATVRLSSANTYSSDTKDVMLRHYVEKMIGPQDVRTPANETFYFFGYNDVKEWKEFFKKYNKPHYELPEHDAAYSFGLAGPQTGVPFHFHGPGFAETLHGRKRWLLSPHEAAPDFSPNKTTLQWFLEDYERVKAKIDFFECTVSPGEAIYFPDKWWHATLNIDTAVFISTFLSP